MATAPCTPSSRRSRRSASAGAGTSSRDSAARSSLSRARSSGCGSSARRHAASSPALVLAAADPAQPYGAGLPWPRRSGARAARVAGAWVVLLDGEAALFVERGGRSLVRSATRTRVAQPALAALVAHVRAGGAKRLAVERFDGVAVTESDAMQLLVEAGFLAGPGAPARPCRVPNARRGAPRRVPGDVPVRAPHLYPLLRGFVLGSFVVLGRELEEGAELPFAFEEHVERRGPPCTSSARSCARSSRSASRRCARGKMRGWRSRSSRASRLRRSSRARTPVLGRARTKRSSAPSSSASSSPPQRLAAASTGTTRPSRRRTTSSSTRSSVSDASTSPSHRSRASR